jgi:3-mercaptopyruvate sulfurtransferase SseA
MFVSKGLRPLAVCAGRYGATRAVLTHNSRFSTLGWKSLYSPGARINSNFIRKYSVLSPESEAEIVDYDKVKKIASHPEQFADTVLIDVREPVEFQDGHIPGALNIPFKSSPGALDLSEEEFKDGFGFDKPSKDKNLIFYCLGGVRSSAAEELAKCFGYKKRGNYVGSWEDWTVHENKQS